MLRVALFVGGSIELSTEMAGALAYITAVVTIARSVYFLSNGAESLKSVRLVYPTKKDLGGIFWLSAISLLIMAVIGAPLSFAIVYFQQFEKHMLPHQESMALSALAILPAYLAWAYLLTPRCLQLIARSDAAAPSEAISNGRKVGISAAVALMLLSLATLLIPLRAINSAAEGYTLHWLESLLVALPYIPLSIAFGVLMRKTETPMAFIDQTAQED